MKKILFALLIALSPTLTNASIFPSDATTQHFEFNANTPSGGSILLATSTRTILSVSWDNKIGAGTKGWLYCGGATEGNEIFENHGGDTNTILVSFLCLSEIRAGVTGHSGDGEHYILTWIPRNIATTQDPIAIAVSGATSTISVGDVIATYDGANFQETLFIACVIIFFLTFIAWGRFFRMFRKHDEI